MNIQYTFPQTDLFLKIINLLKNKTNEKLKAFECAMFYQWFNPKSQPKLYLP